MRALMLEEQSQRNRDGTAELAEFLKSCIDTSINFDGSGISENGFDVRINHLDNGRLEVDFIPFMPFAGLLNEGLYEQIGSVLATALVPMATRITGTGMQVKPTGSTELSNARAFVYQFLVGNVQRIKVDLSHVEVPNGVIPLMLDSSGHIICGYNTLTLNNMIGISGISGGGKTLILLYLISCYLKLGSEIVIIDPKTDQALYHYARKQNLLYVSPAMGKADLNFVAVLQRTLRGALNQIQERQQRMAKDPSFTPRRLVIVLDELLSLIALIGTTKEGKEITGLITKLMVMGRSSNVSVIIASQQLNANVLPTSCREQLSLRLQLTPNLNAKNCSFLFPTLEHPENIIIPEDQYQFGRGLVEIVDGSNQVLPFLSPLIVQGGH